jgi:FkbM family methyltransferase
MKLAGKLYRKISALSYRSFKLFDRLSFQASPPNRTVCETNKILWYEVDGDNTLRVNYDLGPASVIYDVGGYEGDWAAEMASRYGASIYVFEPVIKFVNDLKNRFGRNPTIHILPYGLGGSDAKLLISHLGEASSVFREKNNFNEKASEKEEVSLRAIDQVMDELHTPQIDLIKINIEGGEYDLLECLINKGLISQIRHLQIQFHDFVPDAGARMERIKRELSLTHTQTYEYLFVWENWTLKK